MTKLTFVAFPDDGIIALQVPNKMVPTDAERKGATGILIRFN